MAPLVGYSWDVEDAGGAEAMLRYDVAVSDATGADAARKWLLDYNRGDVEATLALREWLDTEGAEVPSIDSTLF